MPTSTSLGFIFAAIHVADADRSIDPEQERMMVKLAKANTVEVNSSHVAYMSHLRESGVPPVNPIN